jgi:hypothetical protein
LQFLDCNAKVAVSLFHVCGLVLIFWGADTRTAGDWFLMTATGHATIW